MASGSPPSFDVADHAGTHAHEGTASADSVVLQSTDVHSSADPNHACHENDNIDVADCDRVSSTLAFDHGNISSTHAIDHEKLCSTIAVDHAYTEPINVIRHAHTFSTDIHGGTDGGDACHENTEVDVVDSTSHTEIVEHTQRDSAGTVDHASMTSAVASFGSISSTNIVDGAYTDTLDVADNVIAYSTNVEDIVDTCSTATVDQAEDVAATTASTGAANHLNTDSIDDMAVDARSLVVSAVKKEPIARRSSLPSSQRMPATIKEVAASVPDFTPSRRSSRKKQSTFTSDFEYYALGSMKIEIKSEPTLSYRSRRTSSEAQEDDSDEESEDDDEDDSDDNKMKKSLKKVAAEKKQNWKVSEADDSEEDEAEERHFDKGKVKVAVKKKTQKSSMIMKSCKKKRFKREEEESETDDDSDEDMAETQVTPKLLKGHKRKKDEVIKVESKKIKLESHQDDDSSDEEDSTPIALLKAILKEESTPISQLKDKLKEESIPISKLKAELKEESIPISQLKAKLKDPSSAVQHQAKLTEASHSASEPNIKSTEDLDAFSQLQAQIKLKREVEKKASSSQVRSLMERLADGTLDLSVDYSSPFHSLKRKQMASGADAPDEVPPKVSKAFIMIDKLAPALANLVKRLPPPGQGQVKSNSPLNTASPEAAVSNNTASTKKHSSSSGNSTAGSSHKHKVKNEGGMLKKSGSVREGSMLKKSVSGIKQIVLDKTEVSKGNVVKGHSPKHLKEMKSDGGGVKHVKVTSKKDVNYITTYKIIRKPDGTVIKKKVIVPDREIKSLEESKIKIKSSPEKVGGKKPAKLEKIKINDLPQKPTVGSGKMSSTKHNGKVDNDEVKKKKSHEFSGTDGSGLKHKQEVKVKVEHDRKHVRPSLSVDDLLKRGVFHKKKRHQPFGNKNLLKPAVKDLKSEILKDPTKTEQVKKESDKLDMKKWTDKKSVDSHKYRRDRGYSSDSHKYRRDRSYSSDSSRGSRKKSMKADRKKPEKTSDTEEGKDDGPPVLTPASSANKPKHRHHKVEHDVPIDVTMNDLFKPDTQVQQDQPNKDDIHDNDKLCELNDKMSQHSEDTHDEHACKKPESVYSIMMEHQYSKPASPDTVSQDDQLVDSTNNGKEDDIESISHSQNVIMDTNLPDQFLQGSDEPFGNDTDNFQDTWPDTMDDLQRLVDRRDTADRPSILESLGSELKESGTEFLIVGQVEVGRVPALFREERQPQQLQGVANTENQTELEKADDISTEVRKTSVDVRRQSFERSMDSTDKKSSSTDGDRRPSTKDKKSSSEDRKSSLSERKPSSDKKDIASYKKSGSDDKKKSSSEDKRKYSYDDRRKSSSDDKKKASSENKRSSTSEKKVSHEDKRKMTDARSDDVDKRKHKDSKKLDSTELKKLFTDEMDDDSSEEAKFEDDENDIDWEPNDTDTLYCICRRPHNNRFMICCDKCEEWFHGSCVGVSRTRGKEMEDNEEEYICPFCSKGDPDSSMEKRTLSSKSPEQVKSKLLQKCVRRKCSNTPRPGSVYCSNECVMSHAQEALKTIREEQVKKQMSEKQHPTHKSPVPSSVTAPPPKSSWSAHTVEVIDRQTGKLLTGPSAPTQKALHRWLEQHPTFEVVLPHKHRSKSSSSKDKHSRSDKDKTNSSDKDRHRSDKERKRVETEKRDQTSSKDTSRQEAEKQQSGTSQTSDGSRTEDRRDDGQQQIRVNVQAALGDCLAARALEADDIMLSSSEIKSLAVTIEEELFSVFSDTGHKYRTKYRSLVFNIKDQKNKGLFRKILTGKIKPHKLVQMSSEELASRELAMWREQASKHELDMIQKTEQQALKESAGAKHVRKKTHKGEVEVEEEDLSILETRLEEKKDPEPEPQEEQPPAPVIDTTGQHRAHLFDLNCKVCTGKIVPGRLEPVVKAAPEKAVMVTSEQPEEKKRVNYKDDKDDYEKKRVHYKEEKHDSEKKGVYYKEEKGDYEKKRVSCKENEDDYDRKRGHYKESKDYEKKGIHYKESKDVYEKKGAHYKEDTDDYEKRSFRYKQDKDDYQKKGVHYKEDKDDYERKSIHYKEVKDDYEKKDAQYKGDKDDEKKGVKYKEDKDDYEKRGVHYKEGNDYEKKDVQHEEDQVDYEKAEEIVKEALRTMQKMEKSVFSMAKIVQSSPAFESTTPPLSPKLVSSCRDSSPSSSASSMSSSSTRRTVVVRSPDSALQSGLEAKSKYIPTGPMLWKGFMTMLDVAKFFTSAYRVSGPTDHIVIPDTINILGRISPEQMWDYLSKIRQAGSKDLTVVRFIPGSDDEKMAYVHLYSYLNSRGRCGVAANANKQVKDFYIIPLASHSKIPRTLLPFDGPGLEENRPHMLIGVLVRQRGKDAKITSETGSAGKSGTAVIGKLGSQSSSSSRGKPGSQTSSSSSGKPGSHQNTAIISSKPMASAVSRDPRLAKFAAREVTPKVSPADSGIYVSSSTSADSKAADEYEPEYVPMPVNNAYKPVAEYIPTPTVKKKQVEKDKFVDKKERPPPASDLLDKSSKTRKEKYHHHRQEKKVEKMDEMEYDSDPYSPGKEAEPYSPGQEAAADEPYDPADGGLMNQSDLPVISSETVSSSTAASSVQPATAAEQPAASVAVNSPAVIEPSATGETAAAQKDPRVDTRELVERMARSNDPQEISAFMVTALSATSSALEQQQLLVELTSKVEERKLQLAETARSVADDDRSLKLEADVSSSFAAAGETSQVPSVSKSAAVSGGSDTPTNILGSMTVDGALEQTVSSPLLLPPSLPTSISTGVTVSEVDISETKPRTVLKMPLAAHPQDGDRSVATVSTITGESSADIPDALKALINDVMGNTQVSSVEMRRRMVLKKEVPKVDMSVKDVKESRDSGEGQLLDKQAEAQKRLMDEAEALKILETVKKLEQAGSGAKLEQTSSDLSDRGGGSGATPGGNQFDPELADTRKEVPTVAPSISDLLEKLKRGGFQGPIQKADGGPSSSVSVPLVQPAVAPSDSQPCAEQPATTTLSSSAPSSFPTSAAASSSLFSASALDFDHWQKNDLPGSSTPSAAVTSSSGSVDYKAADYGGYNTRTPSTSQNKDETLYQNPDETHHRPAAPPAPKHPLDPFAFPPLPGQIRTYLPPARSNPPLPLGPLHPRFPLPSTDPHAAYQPTHSADPRPKARPLLPGTESDKPAAGSGFVDDFSALDVDFWNRSRTQGSQDRLSPPVPVQPVAPLPPLPGNYGSHYSNQAPGDKNLSDRDSYRPAHTHHTGHHGRGGDRPYQRH
ncbi:hypothetical protein BsWGS_14435 [Bradybaena similaris]